MRDEFEIRSAQEGTLLRFLNAGRREPSGGFDYCHIKVAGAAFSGQLRAYDTHSAAGHALGYAQTDRHPPVTAREQKFPSNIMTSIT